MLSWSDFEEKQLVVITAEEYKNLSLKNDNLLVTNEEGKIVQQISCYKIFCIFIVGNFSITSKLIDTLLTYQITIYHLHQNLKPTFTIGSALEGNYVLRQRQYTMSKEDELVLAKQLIKNKGENYLIVLKSMRKKTKEVKACIQEIKVFLKKIESITEDKSLRGIEGNITKHYFQVFFGDVGWHKRMPRTKVDIINFLLDVGYSFLYNFIEANLNLYGFDIYKGFYHKLFYERKSLVCDIVEPFRCIIDQKIKKMYNLGQVNQKDFTFKNQEYCLSREKSKVYTKHFLEEIMRYKKQIFYYVKEFYQMMMKGEKILPYFTILPQDNADH